MSESEFFVSTDAGLQDFNWIFARLVTSYWGGRYKSESLTKAIRSSLCFGFYRRIPSENGQKFTQVGFARVVTDGSLNSIVTDVYVEAMYRKKGFGSLLMRAVLAHPEVAPTICVLATRDHTTFYEKQGFLRLKAMKRDPL